MATSKQIKMYMSANNATREQAEAHFNNVNKPSAEYLEASKEQDALQLVSPVRQMHPGVMAMPILIECNKTHLTDGVVNYMILKGKSSNASYTGTTKRGALYKCHQVISDINDKQEWYITLENMVDKSQFIMGYIGSRKPKKEDALSHFQKVLQALVSNDDIEAVKYIMKTFTQQPLDVFIMDGIQSGLGALGWAEHKN